jgi:hypothetical protein
MPAINVFLSVGAMGSGNMADALKFTLRAVVDRDYSQEISVARLEALYSLHMMFTRFIKSIITKRGTPDPCPLDVSELGILSHGYAYSLLDMLETAYDPDMKATKALRDRLTRFEDQFPPGTYPKRTTRDFRKMFIASQKKMLKWAGIAKERGIKLPRA